MSQREEEERMELVHRKLEETHGAPTTSVHCAPVPWAQPIWIQTRHVDARRADMCSGSLGLDRPNLAQSLAR